MAIEKILVVDDEMLIRNFLAETLKRKGCEVITAENGKTALAEFKQNSFDMVFTDMKMPDLTGLEVLKRIKELNPSAIVVVVTAFGSIDNAVEAMRLGAFNYLIKPFTPDTIEAVVEKACEYQSLIAENQYLRQEVNGGSGAYESSAVVAESAVMKKILQDVERVANSNASVFISGESGTGKEVISHLIHHRSPRAQKPYVRVNCAAIPESLVESEFFGHEKGAFTGAANKRLGRFELAHSGTLLLDEITEVPTFLQAKLLRAIQEQEFERVGGTKPVKVDVRLISTSNRNVKEAIQNKQLREDLYYRLNVVPIHLPPLRERSEDILPLAEHFLNTLCKENHKKEMTLTKAAKEKLQSYEWPGNVRELGNIIERAVVLETGTRINPDSLFLDQGPGASDQIAIPVGITLQELEKRFIIETLQTHRDRNRAAERLGISVEQLREKLKEYNLS